MSDDVQTRAAQYRDLPAMMALLNHEIVSGVNIFRIAPISPEQAEKWWGLHGAGRYHAIVACPADDTQVVGWATLGPHSAYEGYDRTAEISVWVAAAVRRRGVGQRLIQTLLSSCPQRNIRTVISRIEANNQASLKLHERCGFKQVGLLEDVGEKMGQSLSVVLMQCNV